jgi:hypothetical protein
MYRGKPIDGSIITHETHGDTHYIVAEPGDATRYALLVTVISGELAHQAHVVPGALVVTCLNLRGNPVSMYVRRGDRLHWEDINEGMGIHASGSCYFITELLALLFDVECETYEQFYYRYTQMIESKKLERKSAPETEAPTKTWD